MAANEHNKLVKLVPYLNSPLLTVVYLLPCSFRANNNLCFKDTVTSRRDIRPVTWDWIYERFTVHPLYIYIQTPRAEFGMLNMVIGVTEHDYIIFKRSLLSQNWPIARSTKNSHFFFLVHYFTQEGWQVEGHEKSPDRDTTSAGREKQLQKPKIVWQKGLRNENRQINICGCWVMLMASHSKGVGSIPGRRSANIVYFLHYFWV